MSVIRNSLELSSSLLPDPFWRINKHHHLTLKGNPFAHCKLPIPLLSFSSASTDKNTDYNSMEDQTWSLDLSTASRSYRSKLKSHFEAELCIDFEEVDGEDELNTVYPCPFCADDFDLPELWCHIDEDHSIETNTGICPYCVSWVGTNLVEHISAQHGHFLKSQRKSAYRKLESYQTLSLPRKNLQDENGYWQSFPAESSPEISTAKIARDPLLSFLYCAAADDERENLRPDSSSEVFLEEIHPKESELARDVQPSLSDKDQMGKVQRSEFVQGLFLSTILDPDF